MLISQKCGCFSQNFFMRKNVFKIDRTFTATWLKAILALYFSLNLGYTAGRVGQAIAGLLKPSNLRKRNLGDK